MSTTINAPAANTPAATPVAKPGLTGARDEWIKDTLGIDPKTYKASDHKDDKAGDAKVGTAGPAAGGKPVAPVPAPPPVVKGATPPAKPKSVGDKLKAIKDFVGEHVKVEVKQVGQDDPPKFAITTTINFKGGLDKKGSKSFGDDKKGKIELEAHVKVEAEVKEVYTQLLSHDEAAQYVEAIKNNGKGGKFPEHQVLLTALKSGWERAKEMYAGGAGVADQGKSMQVGSKRHLEASAGADAGFGVKGERDGFGGGLEAKADIKHKNILDIEKLADGTLKVTAAVSDEHGASGAVSGAYEGVKGKIEAGKKSSKAQSVVLILDPNSKEYPAQMKEIANAKTAKDLTKLAEHFRKQLQEQTIDTDDQDSDGAEAGYGKEAANIKGHGGVKQSVTTDRDGKVVKSHTDGNMGVEYGGKHDKAKLEFSKGTGHEGGVDEKDHAEGVLSEHGNDVTQSLMNAAKKVLKGGLKALDKPEDFMAADTRHTGKIDYSDEDLMALCARAQNPAKWNGIVPGTAGKLWAAVGKELRSSTTMENYKVSKINKTAVEKALSEWMASGIGDNMRAIETALRPSGEAGKGHAQSFPKGTEELEKVWKAVVAHDTLPEIKAKLAKTPGVEGIKEAATALQALRGKLVGLRDGFKKDSKLWKDADGLRLAEMQGLVQSRLSQIDTMTQELKKQAAGGKGGDDSGAKLKTYKDELASMQSYHDQVWKVLKAIEGARFPSGNAEFVRDLKVIEPLFFQWDETYKRAEKLAKELKPAVKVDEEELWKLDTPDTVRAYNEAKKRVGVIAR